MNRLIFRLFIKDSENTENDSIRRQYGVLSGAVGITLNLLLFLCKMAAGFLSASIAIIADAFNNLSDAGASVISLIGFKMSGKPADKDHPFGHGRIEYISALFVSIVILLMGVELLKSSFEKITSGTSTQFSIFSTILLCIAVIAKLWMFFFNRAIAKKINSTACMATAKDSISDAAATAVILVGAFISKATTLPLDGYLGALVSIVILYAGFSTLNDALSPLLGTPPKKEFVEEIEKLVMAHNGILGIHDLIIHNYGPTRFMLSLHAEVSSSGDVLALHDTIDLIEKKLCEKLGCDAVIHMDPVETDNELIMTTKKLAGEILCMVAEELSLHDFRMVTGPTHTNLIFDVVVPYNFRLNNDEIARQFQQKLQDYNDTYYAVINFENKYI